MRRSYRLYLEDILESANNILNYAGDLTYEDLLLDKMRLDAIVRNFSIIGEAASNLPQEVREMHSAVEWRKIIDFRNVIVHGYFGIDYEILWDIIRNKLPFLRDAVRKIIESEPE